MRKILLVMILCLFAAAAQAGRMWPPGVTVGKLERISQQQVDLNGTVYPVGAGLRVYDQQGAIVQLTKLNPRGLPYPVAYQIDGMGFVFRMWLLTPEEVDEALALKKALSSSN